MTNWAIVGPCKKWTYLMVVTSAQVSMDFNTSVYPNAVKPLSKTFDTHLFHWV